MAVGKISTDTMHRAVPRRWLSFLFMFRMGIPTVAVLLVVVLLLLLLLLHTTTTTTRI